MDFENLERGRDKPASFSVRMIEPDEKILGAHMHRSPFTSLDADPKQSMDYYFQVEPWADWESMTRFKTCRLRDTTYAREDFVWVANEQSIQRQDTDTNDGEAKGGKNEEDGWVARILDIRASDKSHIFALVCWMYWPEDIPANTRYGTRKVQGRRHYHGRDELIASNHLDVINIFCVMDKAQVERRYGNNDTLLDSLYWRQALDVRTKRLWTVKQSGAAETLRTPYHLLTACGAKNCSK